ncbi:hypothetical protein [Streptomyces sp. NPDC086838]|uniref:hypothetical protein n=1 Tax=Streptomyces sp. NPDC086838 TaxID=3365762 RepID=UPI0038021FF0
MPTPEREPRPPRPTVSMTALLAANAAASAVSTPPRTQPAPAKPVRRANPEHGSKTAAKTGRAAKSSPSGD